MKTGTEEEGIREERKENVKEFVVKVRLVGWKDKVKVEGGEKTWGTI